MGNKSIQGLLDKMWVDYVALNPLAQKIYDLLSQGESGIVNDHIAIRTLNHPRITIDKLALPFLNGGYKYDGEYHFPEKKLYAKSYLHEAEDMPKIFISELKLEEFSPALQKNAENLINQVPEGLEDSPEFVCSGRPWNLSSKIYNEFLSESDYAAWVSAFGFRPNHFTVLVNALKRFSDLRILNEHLKEQGIRLNASGGEVKGTPEVLLEQSSTLANNVDVVFDDRVMNIPGCYYEFARRYPMKNGRLYPGFVAASADKIFESTSRGQ